VLFVVYFRFEFPVFVDSSSSSFIVCCVSFVVASRIVRSVLLVFVCLLLSCVVLWLLFVVGRL